MHRRARAAGAQVNPEFLSFMTEVPQSPLQREGYAYPAFPCQMQRAAATAQYAFPLLHAHMSVLTMIHRSMDGDQLFR